MDAVRGGRAMAPYSGEFIMKYIGMSLFCLALLFPTFARANNCSVPKVLIVLDKSSSMVRNQVNGETLWHWAEQALTNLVTTYDGRIDFGLMLFPGPGALCNAGVVNVDVGPGTASSIIDALGAPPTYNGFYTPMYQSMDQVASYMPLQDPSSQNFVIFISDGWQWCDPPDHSTRFFAVNSVTNLAALDVRTAVIGFYSSVDYLALNRMAVQGMMPLRPGCNPNASFDELRDNPSLRCYQQADNFAELSAALDSLGVSITAEICDGIDNNCNGQIDEGLFRACSTICGTGIEQCVMGEWVGCTARQPEEEICDDIDNNCNGVVDEGCACQIGDRRPCGIEVGACQTGEQVCERGVWSECRNAVWPTQEVCDGVDNDCNGFVDDNLFDPCQTACGYGVRTCVNGSWSACSAPQPTAEVCNAIDDDCNGLVDDGDDLCDDGMICVEGVCVPDPENGDPNGNGGKATAPDGCSCHAGSAPGRRQLPLLLLAGFIAFGIFRRRLQ